MSTVANITVPSDHFIGGERVDGDETFEVISPIDQRRDRRGRPRRRSEAVDRAVDAARARLPGVGGAGAGRAAPPTCTAWPT